MPHIVATIQAEQGEIIRLDHPELLVIEPDGPGTGKTVVALHPPVQPSGCIQSVP